MTTLLQDAGTGASGACQISFESALPIAVPPLMYHDRSAGTLHRCAMKSTQAGVLRTQKVQGFSTPCTVGCHLRPSAAETPPGLHPQPQDTPKMAVTPALRWGVRLHGTCLQSRLPLPMPSYEMPSCGCSSVAGLKHHLPLVSGFDHEE